ncbi:MAG: hypothetical protein IJ343_10785 [Clostridia bacterium]|nr:hypothetical protein [Clostridia bacterium]
MNVTVPDVMRHVRNHFTTGSLKERWELSGGRLTPALFLPGEWIAVTGPDAPGGVYQLDETGAIPGAADAHWEGTILLLQPPEDFLRLCGEIDAWARQHPDPAARSERFGEYSRSSSGDSWTTVFADALAPYRRMYPEVKP